MARWQKSARGVVIAGLLVPAAAPVVAAEDDALMEELVVTARKREERLQDIPGSAAALNSDFIEATGGIQSLRDLTDLIPGITIIETNTQFLSEPNIRGAGQSRNRASVSATGLYRNGAYFATNGLGGKNFSRMDSYDVGRVEALRGPQGALYGRNALGGAINMISKRPGDEFDLYFGYGGDASDARGLQRIDVRADIPLGDNFAARIAHLNEEFDEGYMRDINGDFIDDEEYDLTRVALRFTQDDVEVVYTFDTENTLSYPRTRSRTSTEDLRGFTQNEQNYFVNTDHFVDYDVENHNLVAEIGLPGGQFTSVTNYRDRNFHMFQDTDHQLNNANVASTRMRATETFSLADAFYQEFRYVADGTANLQWLVGMDIYQVDYDEFIDTSAGQTFITESTRQVLLEQDSWALFGSFDYIFEGTPLTLSGEIRYARDALDGSVLTLFSRLPPAAAPQLPVSADGRVIQTDFADDPSFSNLPYGLTLAWDINDDQMAYAKYATSYRHGGLNLNEGQPATDPFPAVLTYSEETSDTFELGYKSSWLNRRLTLNAAAFYIWYDDFLDTATNGCNLDLCPFFDPQTGESLGFAPDGTPIEVDPDGNPGNASGTAFFVDNVGEVEAWGLELEAMARFRLNDSGTMRLSAGWSRQLGQVESINADASSAVQQLADARLNRMRPKQIKASAMVRQGLGGSGIFNGLTLVGTLSYTFESGGIINMSADPTPLDEVKIWNGNFGVEANQWSLMFRGRNISDELYEQWRSDTSGPYMRRINNPASWEFEFTWRLR